jgi:hypothetical protein
LDHKWIPQLKKDLPDARPKDYFVPDFGLEDDIVDAIDNIKSEETRLKHKWTPEQDENGVWIVPEAFNNKSYTYNAAQTTEPVSIVQKESIQEQEQSSDPICSSAGYPCDSKKKSGHPVDYKVPNFGVDEDIKNT